MAQTNQKDRRPPFWLIIGEEREGSQARQLIVGGPGTAGRALAVFSVEEEAQLHLKLDAPKGRWSIEEAAPKELMWMLFGPLCSIRWVALDPMAEAVDTRLAVALVSMSRKEFLDLLSSARASLGRPSASVGANAASGIASERRRH